MNVALAVALAVVVVAGGRAKKHTPPPPAPAPAAHDADAPPPRDPALASVSTAELMQRAKELHDQLEYDKVLPLVTEILTRGDAVPIDTQLDAYVLEGSCLAITGKPIDAEGPFRRLLRGRPDFDLPNDTPPKILSVFRKVQAEEQAIARQMEELTRKRIIKGMQLIGDVPDTLKGGRPIVFDYLLKDPALAVTTVRVQYRKKGETAYSSLALKSAEGRWRGRIPGEWTANEGGAQLQMYVETLDATGPLLTVGAAGAPVVRDIAPGEVDHSAPPPLPPWSVWVGAGTTAALALAGGGFAAGFVVEQQAYKDQAERATRVAQPGAELRDKRELGEAFGLSANGLFIASGVAALSTTAAALLFTDWVSP